MAVKPSNKGKLDALVQRLKSVDTGGGGQGFWSPPQGKSVIRILPPVGDMEFFFQLVGKHYFPGGKWVTCSSFTSEGAQPCPVCEIVDQLYKIGDKPSKALAKELGVRRQYWMNIIDRDDEDAGPKIYTPGVQVFSEITNIISDPDYGDITDQDTGRDVTIDRAGKGLETKYKVLAKPHEKPLGDDDQMAEWLEKAKDLAFVEVTEDPAEDSDIIGNHAVYILPYNRIVTEHGLEDMEFDASDYKRDDDGASAKPGKPINKRKPADEDVEEDEYDDDDDVEVEDVPKRKPAPKPVAVQPAARQRVVRRR